MERMMVLFVYINKQICEITYEFEKKDSGQERLSCIAVE